MTCAIETIGLTKMFGVTRGIEGLDLHVEHGEIFGFLGPNGAGKTTTIRALLDLQRPTAGTALVLGLDAHRDSLAIHARVGYLPGRPGPLLLDDRRRPLRLVHPGSGPRQRRIRSRSGRTVRPTPRPAGQGALQGQPAEGGHRARCSCTSPNCSSSTSRPRGSTPS